MQSNQSTNEKNHNYFYKITNLINRKFYYGIRSTNEKIEKDINYMGSGRAIRKAIKKYGKENFLKEIIADYPTRKEASNHEKQIVTIELINDLMCYNLKTGGDNGFTRKMSIEEITYRKMCMPRGKDHHAYGNPMSDDTRQRISQTLTGKMCGENHWTFSNSYPEAGKKKISEFNTGKTYSTEYKQNMSEKLSGLIVGEDHAFFGKHHTDDTITRISETHKLWNTKHFLHINTGIIFKTRKEVREHFNISQWSVRNWILIGRLQLIDKS